MTTRNLPGGDAASHPPSSLPPMSAIEAEQAFRASSLVFTAVWLATYALLLAQFPDPHPAVVGVSLSYLVYYGAVSLYLTVTTKRNRRRHTDLTTRQPAGLHRRGRALTAGHGD